MVAHNDVASVGGPLKPSHQHCTILPALLTLTAVSLGGALEPHFIDWETGSERHIALAQGCTELSDRALSTTTTVVFSAFPCHS